MDQTNANGLPTSANYGAYLSNNARQGFPSDRPMNSEYNVYPPNEMHQRIPTIMPMERNQQRYPPNEMIRQRTPVGMPMSTGLYPPYGMNQQLRQMPPNQPMERSHPLYPPNQMRQNMPAEILIGQNQPTFPLQEMRQQVSANATRKRASSVLSGEFISNKRYAPKESLKSSRPSKSFKPSILEEETRLYASDMAEELALIEKNKKLDVNNFVHTRNLLTERIEHCETNTNSDWLDVSAGTPSITLIKRVVLPEPNQHFNVIGCLLGGGGAKISRMCKAYGCMLNIRGSGSHQNPTEEERLLESGDPNYAHFDQPLHVVITISGKPSSVYARFSKILDLLDRIVNMKEPFEQDGFVFAPTAASRRDIEDHVPSRASRSKSQVNRVGDDNYSRGMSDRKRRSPRRFR